MAMIQSHTRHLLPLILLILLTFALRLQASSSFKGLRTASNHKNRNPNKKSKSPFLVPEQGGAKEEHYQFFTEEEVTAMKRTLHKRASAVSNWTATNMHTFHQETRRYKLRRERGITRNEVRMMQLLVDRLTNDSIINKYNANFFSNGRRCTSQEIVQQAIAFKSSRVDICYEEPIYKIAHMGYPEAEVFVDIGCNKGYTTALMAGLWSGHNSGLSPFILFQHYEAMGMFQTVPSPAGYCRTGLDRAYPLYCPEVGDNGVGETLNRHSDGQCDSQNSNSNLQIWMSNNTSQGIQRKGPRPNDKSPLQRHKSLSIYSFDGSSSLIRAVSRAFKSLPVLNTSALLNIHLFTAAMSYKNGNISFGSSHSVKENGFEGLSIIDDGDMDNITPQLAHKDGNEVVQMMTLDTFAFTHGIQRNIQFLKIDAEGHDLLVIKGAQSVLNNVGVLIWEQAGFGTAASQTIEYLASIRFECYYVHPGGTIKFTGGCFKMSSMRNRDGVNVVCASRVRAPVAVLAFDLLSSLHK